MSENAVGNCSSVAEVKSIRQRLVFVLGGVSNSGKALVSKVGSRVIARLAPTFYLHFAGAKERKIGGINSLIISG